MDIEFEDNSEKIKELLVNACVNAVHDAGIEMLDQVQRNTKVVTGRTKESWQLDVKEDSSGAKAVVGSNYENAIWEEFGTGEYALHGNGRKGGWFYEDKNGVGHFTRGKTPKRALHNAFTSKRNAVIRIIERNLKEVFK